MTSKFLSNHFSNQLRAAQSFCVIGISQHLGRKCPYSNADNEGGPNLVAELEKLAFIPQKTLI